jgi:hypothetical protein
MPAPKTRDYFAELYVAGMFGDAGWSVYFPKRDVGFDFIATKLVEGVTLLRPVQVKGKYPVKDGKDGNLGFVGRLTALHPDMVLVIPYFDADQRAPAPSQVAFMPFSAIKKRKREGYRAAPARFVKNRVKRRPAYEKYFGDAGLEAVEGSGWSQILIPDDSAEADDVQVD